MKWTRYSWGIPAALFCVLAVVLLALRAPRDALRWTEGPEPGIVGPPGGVADLERPAEARRPGQARTAGSVADEEAGADPEFRAMLRGRLVVMEQGNAIHPQRGVLLAERIRSRDQVPEEVALRVEGARWEVEVGPAEKLLPLQFTSVLGWQAECISGIVEPASGGEPLVEAIWSQGIVLHVLDPDSHAELNEVHLRFSSPWEGAPDSGSDPASSCLGCPPPGSSRPAAGMAPEQTIVSPSPLLLPAVKGTQAAWVGAPGRVWRRLAWSGREGELHLLLPKAAELEVSLEGVLELGPSERAVLRVLIAGSVGTPRLEVPVRSGPQSGSLRFRGLESGQSLVALELSGFRRVDRHLAAVSVALIPGEIARVRMDVGRAALDAQQGSLLVRLRNSLDRASRGSLDQLLLRPLGDSRGLGLEPVFLDRPVPCEDVEPLLTCTSLTRLVPGRYLMEDASLGVERELEVVGGLCTEIDIELPLPLPVRVLLRDAASGQKLGNGMVRIRPAESRSLLSWRDLALDSRGLAFVGTAGAGRYQVFVKAPGRLPRLEEWDIRSAGDELQVELDPPGRGIAVKLSARQSEGSVIPLPFWFWFGAEVSEGVEGRSVEAEVRLSERNATSSMDVDSATWYLPGPGDYRWSFPALTGYELADLQLRVEQELALELVLIPAP
jgi:hypothetical protein